MIKMMISKSEKIFIKKTFRNFKNSNKDKIEKIIKLYT